MCERAETPPNPRKKVTIATSFLQPIYYGFYCRPYLAIFWNGVVTAICTAGGIAVWNPKYHTEAYQKHRAGTHCASSYSWTSSYNTNTFLAAIVVVTPLAIAPILHAFLLVAPGWRFLWPMTWNLIEMGLCYGVGVFFYVSRVPERWFPGMLDKSFFLSHTIWHVWIIFAAWSGFFFYFSSSTLVGLFLTLRMLRRAHYDVERSNFFAFRHENGDLLTCPEYFQLTSLESVVA